MASSALPTVVVLPDVALSEDFDGADEPHAISDVPPAAIKNNAVREVIFFM